MGFLCLVRWPGRSTCLETTDRFGALCHDRRSWHGVEDAGSQMVITIHHHSTYRNIIIQENLWKHHENHHVWILARAIATPDIERILWRSDVPAEKVVAVGRLNRLHKVKEPSLSHWIATVWFSSRVDCILVTSIQQFWRLHYLGTRVLIWSWVQLWNTCECCLHWSLVLGFSTPDVRDCVGFWNGFGSVDTRREQSPLSRPAWRSYGAMVSQVMMDRESGWHERRRWAAKTVGHWA